MGDTFKLVCELTSRQGVVYDMKWTLPDGVDKVGSTIPETAVLELTNLNLLQSRVDYTVARFDEEVKNITHQVGRSTLVVKDSQLSDKGLYKCIVSSLHLRTEHSSYKINVMSK